jgi:DNA adenine methylase
MARPFLKWAGGKSQLLEEILSRRPVSFSRYIEPMIGGGALFFALSEGASPPPAIINDINSELVNAYHQVKEDPEGVISALQDLRQDAESYYRIREIEKSEEFAEWSARQKAARTIYLNKLGFNGLYRVNSSGFFNVPFGKRDGVDFDADNIRAASAALQNCEILNVGYAELLSRIEADDWVYIDPPYLPISETANFTQYNAGGFDISDHRALKEFCDVLTERRTKVLVSNSHSQEIIQLYREYNISIVFAKRSINTNGARRGPVPEVLIQNY